MLARRTAWTALIYTIDDDPVLTNDKAIVVAEPSSKVVLKLYVRAPTTGLSGITITWFRNSAGGDGDQWVAALLTDGYTANYNTTTGVATYTIDSMNTSDFILYMATAVGGETDPKSSVPVNIENATNWHDGPGQG
tara:strand:+ start:243 stop:650 length:408 start_codon:yes stop_codon:yes gene_type:complete